MEQQLRYIVPPEYHETSLQTFLRKGCGMSSRTVVKTKQRENGMLVDGKPFRTIDRVKAGQEVLLTLPVDEVTVEPIPLPLDIRYEDEDILLINKPAGLAVHPSAGLPGPTLANAVVAYYQNNGQNLSFRPLNRLDKNTSGLLLAAKNRHIAYALTKQTEKVYLAVVVGRMEGSGVINQPIRVKEGSCITREVGEGGKSSLTRWKSLYASDVFSLLRVVIETGRTHQIRVHMAWCGHPLAGDTMYGDDQTILQRHGLHCGEMSFVHPATGEYLSFSAPLPSDMADLLKQNGVAGS